MIKKIFLAIIILILLLMGAVFLFAKDIEISVSEDEAQQAINEFLAAGEHQYKRMRISPEYISINFQAGNRAQIECDIDLEIQNYPGQFIGKFSSSVEYRRPRLYLSKLELLEGGFSTDKETQSELHDLKKSALDILNRQRNGENIKTDNTIFLEGIVVSATKAFFERIPIYDIRDSGKAGFAASLALKDVRFTEDTAIIILSPVTALLRMLAILGSILLVLTWVLGPSLINLIISRKVKLD